MHSNRRDFLKKTTTACALASMPGWLHAEPAAATASKWKICAFEKPLQFLSYDELAELMAKTGFTGIEATVRDRGHVLPENAERDLPKLQAALKKRGLEITIMASSINDLDAPHAEKVLQVAADAGVKYYRLLWYAYDLSKPVLPQLESFRPKLEKLAALNRKLGLTGLYQNHAGDRYVGAALWDIYSLIKEFDPREMAIAYDIRHAIVEGGLSWPIQFNLVQSHLGAIFVKDFAWENKKIKNVPLGTGMVSPEVFKKLKSTFSGPISIHVEYMDRVKEAKPLADSFMKDLATLKSWLQN